MWDEYSKHFDDAITKEIDEFTYESVLSQSRYIFIRNEENKHIGYCTNCNEEHEIRDKKKQNEIIVCPKCECSCMIKLTRYQRKYLIDQSCFLRYEKSKIDNNTLIARGFFVERDYSGNYKNVKTKYMEMARYAFTEGKSVMFTRPYWGYYKNQQWSERSSIFKFNQGELAKLFPVIDTNSLDEAVKGTRFEYSQYEKFIARRFEDGMVKYFDLYNRYPLIESLIKIGFKNLIEYKLNGWPTNHAINWRGKTIFKMLKLNRGQVKELQKMKVQKTPGFINLFKENSSKNWKFSSKELKEMENIISEGRMYTADIFKYSDKKKAYKYIKKQLELNPKGNNNQMVMNTWSDYIKGCEKTNWDLSNEHVLYPKDIKKAHKNQIKQMRMIANEGKGFDKKIKSRLKEYEKYNFELDGLCIRAARNSEEVEEEGCELDHCVATHYLQPYAEGETIIMFIRKIEEPDTPYVTVEVKDNKVRQAYGIHDTKPPKEVLQFIEIYKHKVLNEKSRKRKVVA